MMLDNNSKEELDKIFNFIREIDSEKLIMRQTYISDGSRKENDAEHAWHMAVMALLLKDYSNTEIDILRTISMILIHDVVEIDAGDTYAYDEAGKKTQRERELKAADRIFGLLPKKMAYEFRELWDEFEEQKTPEARFARVLDNVQPMMLNDASGGKSWSEHEVKSSQILKRNQNTHKGSEKIWNYAKEEFLNKNIDLGNIIKDV